MRNRTVAVASLMLIFCLLPPRASGQEQADAAYDALQSGDYETARSLYQDRVDQSSAPLLDVVYLAETYLLTGEYADGLKAVEKKLQSLSNDPYVLHAKGVLLEAQGQYDEAYAAYLASAEAKNDLWRNILSLAELFDKTGRSSQAAELYNYLFRPFKNNEFRTADDLGVAGKAAAHLGEYRDANEAFRTAYQLDPKNVRNLYWWGDLFRQKYNDADAQRNFDEALVINQHYAPLYIAYARSAKGFAQQESFANKALEHNPNSVDARSILAGLHILDGLYDQAVTLAEEALAINPMAVEALAHLATVHHLRGDLEAFAEVEERAIAINARASLFYITLAKNCELKFRYPDAATFAERAIQTDRRNPEAYAQLGISLLRLGRSREARRYLDASFDADPYNLFIANTLTLLDEYEDFALLESEHFTLLIHNTERDVLGPAMLSLAEANYAELSARYQYVPDGKIMIEAYNDADDFAVRIAGVPHLGLLGVSFGDVLALNTPKGQEEGTYNWSRTLWHELVHTMSIGAADFKLPRWFAEGLAVYEEQRARPEWGREMQLELLMALDQDKLLPLTDMDRGFTRPTFQGQILLSYYHSSRIIGFIAETYGFDAIVKTLQGFAAGRNDRQSLEEATGVGMVELDAAFRTSLAEERAALADVLEGMPNPFVEEEPSMLERLGVGGGNDFLDSVRKGHEALSAADYTEAERHFEKAIDLYAPFTDPGNPYTGLAAVYRAQQDDDKLIRVLEQYLSISEHGSTEAVELAGLLLDRGNIDRAIYYYERSLEVAPYDREVHAQLATLYANQQQFDKAVQARRAILGLNPVDRAEAFYQYALSLQADTRESEAKRAVLQALELAPGYREAQKLLLQVVEE